MRTYATCYVLGHVHIGDSGFRVAPQFAVVCDVPRNFPRLVCCLQCETQFCVFIDA